MPAAALRVAAITPFTTIDFPGRLSAVVFVQGCPWRCVYCHNDWMQSRASAPESSWDEVMKLLSRRKGLLDGVVFSGGEPTVDHALPEAMRTVKSMGFEVGLHTGGSYPDRLAECLPLIDWVGLDVKAVPTDPEAYDRVTGVPGSCAHFLESYRMIREAGVELECRTTAHPAWLPEDRLLALADWLKDEEVDTFALQIYRQPPGSFLARFDRIGADYPAERALAALKGAVRHFTERRG